MHQTDTAYSWLVCHSATVGGTVGGEHCKLYLPTPPLRRSGHPVFLGSQPCVPAAWLVERLLLAGDIESNPGPKLTLKTLTHTRTSVQPQKTPTCTSSPPAPTLTPYTLDRIQPTRPDSPHISPSHKLPYVATPTTPTPAPHTRTLPHTQQTKDLQNKTQRDTNSSTQRKLHKVLRGRT